MKSRLVVSMKKIKTKLVSVFLFVIALMLILNVIFLILHFKIVGEYRNITDNMFLEYKVIETTNKLIQTHYVLIKSVSEGLSQEYNQLHREIESLFTHLDKAITYRESKVVYRGLKNIIRNIIEECDISLKDALKGNISEGLEIYAEVMRKNYYVKDNFANLILKELEYANILQARFQKTHSLIIISGIILLIFITFGCVVFAFIFSKKLTNPLVRLSNLAKDITKGNLIIKVEEDLLDKKDEIGILAVSFNTMVVNLQENIAQLNASNKQLKQAQAQLVQSAKMASIGQLAGGVAHGINNPLTGVLNNVQLIKMEQEAKGELSAAELKDLLGVIEESALRCKKITQSLLNFSYASKGIVEPVSLNESIERVIELIGYEMNRHNIVIQKQFLPDLPKVAGDSQLLQQAIFDVVSNARWAIQEKSGKEGGTITIKTEYEPKSKQVCISISDTGIGIAPENLQRIFEPFFTTKRVGEGTGLGLSIVYNIIKEHNGTIEVESKVNEGSTFRIKLPL